MKINMQVISKDSQANKKIARRIFVQISNKHIDNKYF